MPPVRPSVDIKFFQHALDEVLGPPRRRDDSVGNGFAKFFTGGSRILRDREVLGESVRAIDRDGAGHPDQLAGFKIEDFRVFKVENPVAVFHVGPPAGSVTPLIYSRFRVVCPPV